MLYSKLKTLFFALGIIIACVPIIASGPLDDQQIIKIKVDKSKLRYTPSNQGTELKTLEKGTLLETTKKDGDWYQVSFVDKSGFTIAGYIHQNDAESAETNEASKPETKLPIKTQPTENPTKVIQPTLQNLGSEPIQISGSRQIVPDHLRYKNSGKILMTTMDLRYDYEIIDVLVHYQEFGTFTLRDPLANALSKGMQEFEKKAVKQGGEAIIGLRYQFMSRTEKDEGRLLIYGTLIKFK